MKTRTIKKGTVIQRKGDLNTKVYVVKSGLLRSYTIDKKGKEHIFLFAPEDWSVADGNPPDTPCEMYIDALEDTVVVELEKTIENAQDTQSLVNRILALQQRVILLMSATAVERYNHFVETYPNIVQRVPQKMIASYLGVTPEALSTAKSQQLRNMK